MSDEAHLSLSNNPLMACSFMGAIIPSISFLDVCVNVVNISYSLSLQPWSPFPKITFYRSSLIALVSLRWTPISFWSDLWDICENTDLAPQEQQLISLTGIQRSVIKHSVVGVQFGQNHPLLTDVGLYRSWSELELESEELIAKQISNLSWTA